MKRSSVTLDKGIALPNGRGQQLIWRSRAPVWNRSANRRGNLMLPGYRSTDAAYISFLRILSRELNKQLPVEITDEGFSGENGVNGTFDKLRTLSGVGMVPLTYLPRTNALLGEQLRLPQGFKNPRHERIFNDLVDLMWGSYTASPLRVAKHSTWGFPFFTSKDEEKLALANYVLKNANDILAHVMSGKLEELARKHAVISAYFMGVRGQADNPGKERMVNDYEYARTGGRAGRRFAASKEVTLDGNKLEDFNAMRMRTVCGLSASVNILINVVQYGVRSAYAAKFPFTWKHTTVAEKEERVNRFKFAIDLDVTNFDQSAPNWMFQAWYTRLERFLSPEMLALFKLAHHSPYFQPSVDGEQPGRWMGNPLDPASHNLQPGLMSGIATVSDLGKLFMVFTYLCMLDDIEGDVIEFGIARILRGEHPRYAMLNMGDDCRILLNDWDLRQKLIERITADNEADSTQPRSTYFALDLELGGTFVGDVIIRDRDRLRLVPSIISYFEKWWVAERGIDSKFRSMWYEGFFSRKLLYANAPAFNEAIDIEQFAWRKANPGYESIQSIVERFAMSASAHPLEAQSVLDAMVLQDPSKIHYAVDVSDLSEGVRDSLVMSIPYDNVAQIVRTHYNGEINE